MNKFIFIFLILFSGCSIINQRPVSVTLDSPMEIVPLSTQNLHESLAVSVKATAKTEIPATLQLIGRLTALKERNIVGDALYVFPKRKYNKDETYEYTISVSSPEITDYQLSLIWGEEADKMLLSTSVKIENSEPNTNVSKKEVILTQIETAPAPLECTKGICKTGVTISGNFKNNDNTAKSHIKLGVVLIDETGKELGPEEILNLDDVILPPNSETPFEVGVTLPDGISGTDTSAKVTIK